MTELRRADRRHHEQRDGQERWSSFDPPLHNRALADRFGYLELLEESRVPPGATVKTHARRDSEVVTYVREGALAFTDSTGGSGVLVAGEFRRMTTGRNVRHEEANASSTDWLHYYQLWFRPDVANRVPSTEQRRFSTADRRGHLCVVSAPDARKGSLRVHQDAIVYSAILDDGQHVIHQLLPGRSAWLHLVHGEATIHEFILADGDGIGIATEGAVALTAHAETEILLVDVAAPPCVSLDLWS